LSQQELISPVGNDTIIESVAQHVLIDQGIIGHHKKHLLKVGVGVDGSIIGAVMSDIHRGL
ncbi:beta-ketoacyl synthase, partial [Enterobacter cloacae complex sp. 743-2DZ2F-22B]